MRPTNVIHLTVAIDRLQNFKIMAWLLYVFNNILIKKAKYAECRFGPFDAYTFTNDNNNS